MSLPTREQAKKIFFDKFDNDDDFFHDFAVAEAAALLAKECDLDVDKAFVLGFLHDYGYPKDGVQQVFHGQSGYDELMLLGYDEAAKVCLTHSFPNKDTGGGNYKKEWLGWIEEKLKEVEYDDYDRLIQFCDMFFNGEKKLSIEERVKDVAVRHHINELQQGVLLKNAFELRKYFEKKSKSDIYELLGVSK